MAYCCTITTTKWNHVSLFLESKKKKSLIRLHSSAFINSRLVTRLHSSETSLHSSTLVYVFRIDPLLQSKDQVTFDEHAVFTINTLTRGFCFIQCVTQFLRIGSVWKNLKQPLERLVNNFPLCLEAYLEHKRASMMELFMNYLTAYDFRIFSQ